MTKPFTRRDFLSTSLSTSAGLTAMLGAAPLVLVGSGTSAADKPAILGGTPMSTASFSGWPILQGDEEANVLETLRSGHWFRGYSNQGMVAEFEKEFAAINGAKACVATANGTGALIAALAALDIGPGDEVITTPYTFIATINSIIAHFALPVPIDVDPDTFQLDGKLADAAWSENTRCLLPVHIGGLPANMDDILAVGKKRNIRVIEDACQAHLGRWKGKNLGTLGHAGCFSFQVSKNLSGGEGGAVLTNDEDFAERVYRCHNNCSGRRTNPLDSTQGQVRAFNFRMAEFPASVLRAQLKHIEQFAEVREENGRYLNRLLAEIPGVYPTKIPEDGTRSAWHLYMFRIDPEKFGIDRNLFIQAMGAEGIHGGGGGYGYGTAKHWIEFVRNSYATPAGKRIYSKAVLDDWAERVGALPQAQKVVSQGVWFSQNMLLGPKTNMDIIADAARRIQKNAAEIAKG
ncbi:MAG: DegT/DnrJ/EryC1/StrS family aminotransferase [Planctomycetaceae bacterium]|nr:DegT/DnrJ/EryC1/StrS family aminotransferase [Planctomycetaceae bacterium]